MKGNKSDNTLFKSLPELLISAFQGSKISTSKGVLDIFKKTRNLLIDKNQDENKEKITLFLIFFKCCKLKKIQKVAFILI